MDRETFNPEKSDFISALEKELSGVIIPEDKAAEIKKYLENDNRDYHSFQAIVDILVSIPETEENEDIIKLKNKMIF